MYLGVTDLPLEIVELTLIFGLIAGLFMQNQTLKRDKLQSDKRLSEATDELRHLRRMLDKILLVEKGYARPSEDIDEPSEERRDNKSKPTLL